MEYCELTGYYTINVVYDDGGFEVASVREAKNIGEWIVDTHRVF